MPIRRTALALLCAAALVAPFAPAPNPAPTRAAPIAGLPKPAVLNQYDLDVRFNPDSRTVAGSLSLRFTNGAGAAVPDLLFHLYPNAAHYRANGGAMSVSDVRVDGQSAASERVGFDLRVALARPLAPGDAATVDLRFETTVPTTNDRFGQTGSVVNLAHWYPILAVHDGSGWRRDDFIDLGDPFVSEVAAYRVRFSLPPAYTVAATGRLVERADDAGRTAHTYTAEPVRDFALAFSPRLQVIEREVAGTTIRVYHAEGTSADTARATLAQAASCFQIYTDAIGEYPYADLAVVHSAVGMEYPQLVFVEREGGEYLTCHEVAHQWWYGVVGNDGFRGLWDEGLTNYTYILYVERRYGGAQFQNALNRYGTSYRTFGPAQRAEFCLGCDLYYYASRGRSYSPGVYRKGAAFFHALRGELGDETFFTFLRAFYRQQSFAIADWTDLANTASAAAGRDMGPFFARWLAEGGE